MIDFQSLQTLKTMFEEIFESPTDPNLSSAPVVRLWLSTFDDMVTTDPRRGKLVINAVKEWLCQISTQEKRDFSTFENYVEYRKIDCGF